MIEPTRQRVRQPGLNAALAMMSGAISVVKLLAAAAAEEARAGILEIDGKATDVAAVPRAGARVDEFGRVFHREAQRGPGSGILDQAQLPVADIIEARNVIGLDGHRDVFLAGRDPDGVLSEHAPGLAAEEVEAPLGVESLGDLRRSQETGENVLRN